MLQKTIIPCVAIPAESVGMLLSNSDVKLALEGLHHKLQGTS
jgi:hypothetical protein